eukprot:478932-Amphidinium_carterae.1
MSKESHVTSLCSGCVAVSQYEVALSRHYLSGFYAGAGNDSAIVSIYEAINVAGWLVEVFRKNFAFSLLGFAHLS